MAVVAPEHWFLGADQTRQQPNFTTGNTATAFVDGKGYMADLRETIDRCSQELLIAGWRVSSEQILDPVASADGIAGPVFVDAVVQAARRGCAVKALLFNVPGTELPGPFRIWHAKDNVEFAKALVAAGGEAQLDSRLPPVPASAHHQKFIVATSKQNDRHVAYVGGIDVCLDRWDVSAHDGPPERQTDYLRLSRIETHTASQPGWHDIQVRVEGPAVAQLWQAFCDRWNDPRPANHDPLLRELNGRSEITRKPPEPRNAGTLAVQVNQTLAAGIFPTKGGPGEATVARAHERAIDLAEHYIYVEDQYVWPCSLVEHLEAALRRGVRVLMVVARDYDAPGLSIIAKRLRLQVVERLRRAGGTRFGIFHLERRDGKQIYVHSKVLLIDDCYASIGSANFNARSLTNDSELQLGIVDTDLVETTIGGTTQKVCRFAHELRCSLWAEHLECESSLVRDPLVALDTLWARAPIEPSMRAHPHDIEPGLLNIDPIAEYVTTLITGRIAKFPIIPLPPQVDERATVKLAVDTVLRGPQAALLLKLLEELLNPDIAPLVAAASLATGDQLTPSHVDRKSRNTADSGEQHLISEQILAKLRRRQLPQMVDWFDPALLARIGVRDIISGTIGQYADQRLMQAASDRVLSEKELADRYDFSDPGSADHNKRIKLDDAGAVWVDYVADLGDGFEATYAIAHLLAQSHLKVAGLDSRSDAATIPAGEILVMGGDQCYPQGTQAEYERRLVEPYDWAFATDTPRRKLFAIPGNHDWYDGLSAFSSLFTSARDRISGGIGRQIGGWLCCQHRSYFAIKLPHDWWIWGPDIQLEGDLDDPQRDYFDIISDHTKPGDKIVICLAEPSWHHQNYDNLHEISMLARKRGAKVCAVLAGDWHHYSRYTNSDLGVQFITCGGGGAFAHATHQLKSRIDLQWVEVTGADHKVTDPKDPIAFNKMEARILKPSDHVDFSLGNVEVNVTNGDTLAGGAAPIAQRSRRRPSASALKNYRHHAPRIYPSKAKSRLLGLKNLLLPFRNQRFAWFVGCIYFLYAWVFEVSAPKLDTTSLQIPKGTISAEQAKIALSSLAQFFWSSIGPTRVIDALQNSPMFFFMLLGLWGGLVYYVELGKGLINGLLKFVIGTAHFLMHLTALLVVSLAAFIPAIAVAGLLGAGAQGFGIAESSAIGKSLLSLGFMAGYALLSIAIGGFVGALIMGVYWTLTSLLMNMHCGDAFGALMIKDYKHFLRMRFEPDQLTIYPIAIDKVPGRRGWRVPTTGERLSSPSMLVPKKALEPHLIEPPIVIKVADIRS